MDPTQRFADGSELRLQLEGGDLLVDIPAGMVAQLEGEYPGVGRRDGYRLHLPRRRVVDVLLGSPPPGLRLEERRDERYRVEAWVNELGQLEVSVPRSYDTLGIEIFLDEHPEHREEVEATLRRSLALRRHCELVIGEIYAHYLTGAPSADGLIASLRSLAAELESESAGR